MKKTALTILVGVMCLISGCAEQQEFSLEWPTFGPQRDVIVAKYTQTPVKIDGKLDDAAWQDAQVYTMSFSKDKEGAPQEGACVSVAWDDEYLYLGVEFDDSDLVAEGMEDQLHHYSLGDVCELFLKPVNHTWYWELYVTPHGKKTSFRIPGSGRLGVPSALEPYPSGLKVAAGFENGTLNDFSDVDNGWVGEMAMPVADLTANGEDFGLGSQWRILVARYNYSVHLNGRAELSMVPQLSATSYHLIDEYATLQFEK